MTYLRYLILLLTLLHTMSCVRYRDLVSFRELPPDLNTLQPIPAEANLSIQANDLLQITVSAGDSEAGILAAAPFNMNNQLGGQQGIMFQQQGQQIGGSGQSNYQPELMQGYFVDADGFVTMPTLGKVSLGGLSLLEAQQKMLDLLQPYLERPAVDMRFLNLKVTVSGEVLRPGLIRFSNQRMTILEALGNAGELTPYANRRNVLVVREIEGQRSFYRLDLTSSEIFSSPAFYLKQNDYIYVEPMPIKVAATPDLISRIVSYSTAALSIISVFIALGRQ
jgi:polysaccharide export outer membrane protein